MLIVVVPSFAPFQSISTAFTNGWTFAVDDKNLLPECPYLLGKPVPFSTLPNDISFTNKKLIISERLNEIYLPYKKTDLSFYIEKNPNEYNSLEDVVKKEMPIFKEKFKRTNYKYWKGLWF